MRKLCVVVCVLMLFVLAAGVGPPTADASVLSEFVVDLTDTAVVDLAVPIAEATTWATQVVTEPDAMNYLFLVGDKATNEALGSQLKFGSYEGSPFLFNAGILTKEPAKGRMVLGLGSRIGSAGAANANGYIEVGPDELTSNTLDSVGLPNWGVLVAVGLSLDF